MIKYRKNEMIYKQALGYMVPNQKKGEISLLVGPTTEVMKAKSRDSQYVEA